jgi:hypothetical protein
MSASPDRNRHGYPTAKKSWVRKNASVTPMRDGAASRPDVGSGSAPRNLYRGLAMIEAFRNHLSAAWSRTARSVRANRRRLSTFGERIRVAIAMPVLPAPALAVVRTPVATRRAGRAPAR